MKHKTLFTIILAVTFFSLPISAYAASVQWATESYEAYAYVWPGYGIDQTTYGPPLPITAHAEYGPVGTHDIFDWAVADVEITDSYMYTALNENHSSGMIAQAKFTGTFFANQQYFLFTYDNEAYNYTYDYSWLKITDITTGSSLYDQQLNGSSSDTVLINLTDQHEISVEFGIHNGYIGEQTLTYSTAVVPEPISSILFVTGGTLLAGQRYIKRRKKA
jgi:hypothetical protein